MIFCWRRPENDHKIWDLLINTNDLLIASLSDDSQKIWFPLQQSNKDSGICFSIKDLSDHNITNHLNGKPCLRLFIYFNNKPNKAFFYCMRNLKLAGSCSCITVIFLNLQRQLWAVPSSSTYLPQIETFGCHMDCHLNNNFLWFNV